jgi:hypothetical protein
MTTVNIKLYYRIKYYQISMMKKRGFELSDVEERIISGPLESTASYELFKAKYLPTEKNLYLQDTISSIYEHKDKDSRKTTKVLYVRETDESKANILTDTTTEVIENINDAGVTNVILIVRVPFRSTNLNDLKSLVSFNIQIFLHQELFFDPTEHELQPKFELMSISDSKKFLGANPDNKNVKAMCFDDPVVKFLGGVFDQIMIVKRVLNCIAQTQRAMEYKIITKTSITEYTKKEDKSIKAKEED